MPRLQFEVFPCDGPRGAPTVVTDAEALEDERLQSYEKGYAAGWEDAASAHSDEQARLGAEIAQNLRTLGFTYHEARVHVLRAVEPLLARMVEVVLPVLARETLAPLVVETLRPHFEAAAEAPISVVFNPVARPALEAALAGMTSLPLTLTEEPTLGEGQVWLRMGDSETQIDLDRALADISAALRDFFELATKDATHG